MQKLIAISGLYKYDTPNGLRITFTRDIGELELYFQILKDGYDELWRDAVYGSKEQNVINSMFKELNTRGKRKRKYFQLKTSAALMGAIYMLEQVGHLKTDKYNGIKLEYAELN